MLKFTVLTVIAAVALCEDLDALQNVDINKLLESLQSQIELTQLGETQHKGTVIDSGDDQYDRYGSLTDQQLQNFLLQVSNDKTPKPKAVSFKSQKSVGPKVQDDEFKKVLESTLMDFSNGGKPKEYNRFDDKINSYGIKDAKQKSDLSLIHQLLTKEDDRIRNQKPNKNHDYPVVNEKLSNHILGKLLKYKKDTLEKRSKEKMLENMLRDTSQVIALVQDSSEENQGNDKVDLDDNDDYSKVYVVLNSEAVKSSANKNKLNALLNSLLSPPRSQKKSQGKYKGFLLNETVEGLQQRRRGGSDDDDMDGGRESYMPKRQSGGGGRGGGGGGRGRGGGGGGRGGGGGGRGGGGGGGGGGRGGRGRGKAGRGGGGGGYTAIPYMNHRGNIYENEKY